LGPVLTQPAAIRIAKLGKEAWRRSVFDAGDVQANGFQMSMMKRPADLHRDRASYMGLLLSLLARGSSGPFTLATGDCSS
jgi:hypothetical protein